MELHGFALRDQVRRALGRQFDELGWGPLETASELVLGKPGVRLKAYNDDASGPVVLLVPAPIKRAYILDLAPHCSVVQRVLAAGCRPYLLEWDDPGADAGGLDDYAQRLILDCVEAIAQRTGEPRMFIAAHSLGGTLAAIFAALHPQHVAGLVLLAAPLHFDAGTDVFAPLLAGLAAERLADDNVPGSLLNTVTYLAAPYTIGCTPWLDRFASMLDEERTDTLMRVDRWAHDEMPLSGRLIADVVQRLFGEDALMRGTLVVGGRGVQPARLIAPLVSVVDPRCALVPPRSVAPFHDVVGSTDTRLMHYQGDAGVLLQHVGMLVGQSAHRRLWPQILHWIRARAATAARAKRPQ
jgi:polyhydroxyalkanoate synthase